MDSLFTDALRDLLIDRCGSDTVRAVEGGGDADALWTQLEDSGFADAMVPEDEGGAGLGLPEVFALLELCGEHIVPVPLGQTILVRGVLAAAGVARPRGSIVFGLAARGGTSLRCAQVPFGRVADHVLTLVDGDCVLLPAAPAQREADVHPLNATLTWPVEVLGNAQRVAGDIDVSVLQACVLAAELAGTLMAVFRRTLQYANDRQQFGRSIGKFQAVQHQLSVISEHAFAARMAAQIGCNAPAVAPCRLRAAIAKARASEAALEVATLAHSIHGAIGFTEEFDLQLYTRRLHAGRQAGGSESYWHDMLGETLTDRGCGMALDVIRAASQTQ